MEGAVSAEIRRLASSLGPVGALVIFPEGGNFTPRRWRRGIAALEAKRRFQEARRARGMANLLPPRAGGAFAAIDSAPTADVIFVAHTGLDDLITMGDVWRALPMEQVIKAKWWRVPAAEVPRERADVVAWLYDWWERIDTWIEANRPARPEVPTEVPMATPTATPRRCPRRRPSTPFASIMSCGSWSHRNVRLLVMITGILARGRAAFAMWPAGLKMRMRLM